MEYIRYLLVCLVNYTKGQLENIPLWLCQFESLPNAIIGPQLVQQLAAAATVTTATASIGAKLMLYYVYAACRWPARTSARTCGNS